MKINIVCSNGQPVRIRYGKNLDGRLLNNLGCLHAVPGIRYDITHSANELVRLVKIYRYADVGEPRSCDITFWDAGLNPICEERLLRVPCDPELRCQYIKDLAQLQGQAIFVARLMAREDYSDDDLIF